MTIESSFDSVSDLNASYPESNSLISEGDDHIRGIKNVLKTQLGSLGSTALTLTGAQLNKAVIADENSEVAGNITFASENYGLKWKSTAFTDPIGYDITFTGFSVADPYVGGGPIIGGLSLNCPIVQLNNPVTPSVTSGFQIYFRGDDTAPACGFEFIDAADSNNRAGGVAILDGVGATQDLLVAAHLGQLWFKDTVANGGNPIQLNNIVSRIAALEAIHGI